MWRVFYNKRAQSMLEYTMIILVISAALITMQQYMRRSLNARLRQVQIELNESRR